MANNLSETSTDMVGGSGGGGGGQGSVHFSQTLENGEGHNIFCDKFFKTTDALDLSNCRWEAWYRPELAPVGSYTGYVVVHGQGGDHECLLGWSVNAVWSSITGNFHVTDGGLFPNSFTSLDEASTGEFHHMSVMIDITPVTGAPYGRIFVHLDGVLSNVIAIQHPRVSTGTDLYLSGSDHNNAAGYLFGARGYEGAGFDPNDYRRNFNPDRHFVPIKANLAGDGYERAVFCMMTDYPTGVYLDTSDGWESIAGEGVVKHHGHLNVGKEFPPRNTGVLPEFAAGIIPQEPTVFPDPTETPVGALVYDDFNRQQVLPTFRSNYAALSNYNLGNTMSGSLGVKAWAGSGGWGILSGRAFATYQADGPPRVTTDRTDVKITVKRMQNSLCKTGITARFVDLANRIHVNATPIGITIYNVTSGGTTNYTWPCAADYSTVTLNVNGPTASVYRDGVLLGNFTVQENGSFIHGLFADCQLDDIYRFDEFTIYAADAAPDSTPEITTLSLPNGTDGVAYSQNIAVTGGNAPLTFTVQAGVLPSGLNLNAATGAITGTPDTPETQIFTIRCTDVDLDFDDQALSITVDAAGGGGGFEGIASAITRLRASDIVGLSDNDPVGNWTDTISGNNATGSGSARPTYKAGGGDPYVEFDGTDDRLTMALPALNDFAYLVIVEVVSLEQYSRIIDDGQFALFDANGNIIPRVIAATCGGIGPSDDTIPVVPTGYLAIFAERTGTTMKLRINGNENSGTCSGTATGTAVRIGEYIGDGYNMNMRVKEIVVFDDNLDAGEFSDAAAYVLSEYGLTL